MKYKIIIKYGLLTIIFVIVVILIFNLLSRSGSSIKIEENLLAALPKISIALLVIIGTKLFLELTKEIFKEVFEKIKVEYEGLLKIWSYIIWAIGLFLALSIIVGNLSGFLLSLGLIGFGLTFAMQTPLSCFVAWIFIVTKKPFRINDRIKIEEIEGDVVDITLMYTILREVGKGGMEPTGKLITFPNSLLLQKSVVNYTLDVDYMWDEISIAVTYESDRELAENVIKECATEVVGETMGEGAAAMRKISSKEHGVLGRGMLSYIQSTPQIRISLAESYVEITVRYICKVRERRKIRTEISRKILDKFKTTKGIEIAYPHMEIITREKK